MTQTTYVSKLVFKDNSIYLPNTFVDLDIVSTKNKAVNIQIYPTIRVFFSIEGYIYIFVGNYQSYKTSLKYGISGDISSNNNQRFNPITDRSDSESYYIFSNNELKFLADKSSEKSSWSLTFLTNVSNIYVANKNTNSDVSGLDFSLFASDSDMDSDNIFRIDNRKFSAADMKLIITDKSIPDNMKILYNRKYWDFYNCTNCEENSRSKDSRQTSNTKTIKQKSNCGCK